MTRYAVSAGVSLLVLVLGYCVYGVATTPKDGGAIVAQVTDLQKSVEALNTTTTTLRRDLDAGLASFTKNVSTTLVTLESLNKKIQEVGKDSSKAKTDARTAKADASTALTAVKTAQATADAAKTDAATALATANAAAKTSGELEADRTKKIEAALEPGWNQIVVTTTWNSNGNPEVWAAKAGHGEEGNNRYRTLLVRVPSVRTLQGAAKFCGEVTQALDNHMRSKTVTRFNTEKLRAWIQGVCGQALLSNLDFELQVGPGMPKKDAATAPVVANLSTGSSAQ